MSHSCRSSCLSTLSRQPLFVFCRQIAPPIGFAFYQKRQHLFGRLCYLFSIFWIKSSLVLGILLECCCFRQFDQDFFDLRVDLNFFRFITNPPFLLINNQIGSGYYCHSKTVKGYLISTTVSRLNFVLKINKLVKPKQR